MSGWEGGTNFLGTPGRAFLGASLNAIPSVWPRNSANAYFLETGNIACGARDSLKESSLDQGHCSILALCGL